MEEGSCSSRANDFSVSKSRVPSKAIYLPYSYLASHNRTFSKKYRVGNPSISYNFDRTGFAVASTSATLISPLRSSARSSQIGASFLQCPHHYSIREKKKQHTGA